MLRWTSGVEIPHIQGQRNPSKMVGTGVAVRSYPMSKGKGEPQQDSRKGDFVLGSNPIPARDAKRVQTNLVYTRTQGPHRH